MVREPCVHSAPLVDQQRAFRAVTARASAGGFSKLPMEQTHPEATKVVEIDLDAEQTKAGAPLGSPMAAWSEADVGNWVGSVPRLRPSEVELVCPGALGFTLSKGTQSRCSPNSQIRAALHHAEIDGHELAALRRKPLRALLRGAGLDDHTPPGDRPWEGASLTTIVACVGGAARGPVACSYYFPRRRPPRSDVAAVACLTASCLDFYCLPKRSS